MALALNNLKRVDMPLNKESKPNQTNARKVYPIKKGHFKYEEIQSKHDYNWKRMEI